MSFSSFEVREWFRRHWQIDEAAGDTIEASTQPTQGELLINVQANKKCPLPLQQIVLQLDMGDVL